MNAFLYSLVLKWKMDLRDKGILLTYYVVPIIFYLFISGIFNTVNPSSTETLIQAMSVFGVTMGAVLGSPSSLIEIYGSEVKKAYKVGNIPLWLGAVNNILSGLIHLFILCVIIYLTAPLIFNAKIPANPVSYFILLALFILVSLAVGTILGLYVKNASKLTIFGQLIFLPSLMLSGIMFPTNLLPDVLIYVGKIFPASWGFSNLNADTFNFNLIYPLLIILIISFVISLLKLNKIAKQ